MQKAAIPAISPNASISDADIAALEATTETSSGEWWKALGAQVEANTLKKQKAGSPGKPAEDYWTEASTNQYDTCLRSNGVRS